MATQRQIMSEPVATQRSDQKDAVVNFLATKCLVPTSAWLDDFLQQPRSSVPLSSLQQTALYRLLTTDLTVSTQRSPSSLLPAQVAQSSIVELQVPGPIIVQLLDIEDIGSSAWSQIETIESQERGETTRGNQVIRTLPDENGEAATTKSRGPHKLTLQDAAGTKVYAFQMQPIAKIELGCAIGLKLSLKNIVVARGILLLNPSNTVVLGGKIEAADRAWHAGRKQRLQQKIASLEG
ncbi:hypothetical protein AMS68_005709 [Peltaster fructicola]|uniref:RecQ-mediated genome instability protein 1 n=1 Tax=Peltaster fructicola TaxID=286661 RepID=A0A6H0XZJ1_9PEZI|nr:hypothetical protein AMS68_005709 [Peltaster fructicola]